MSTSTNSLKTALFAGCALLTLGGTARAADAPATPRYETFTRPAFAFRNFLRANC